MKKIFFFLSFVLVIMFSCTSNETKSTGDEVTINPDNVVMLDIDVEGMTCTGCENTIKEGVSGIAGVVEVEAYHTDGKAFIKYDTSLTSVKEIAEMISSKGYKVTGYEKGKENELVPEE
jgi:copper chaperone CopZ